MWTFEQLIGIYYVQVPIRMTCVAYSQGLMIYAPVAPTQECLSLLAPLIEEFGEIKHIILPSVAVEHKVNAGPFARKFPSAEFWAVDKQYAFPLNLPSSFLGLPSWTKPLPSRDDGMWGDEFAHAVLTVKPGPGSMYQDVAMWHKPSKTLLLCDALFGVSKDPPEILTAVEEHRRALLFHARDARGEMVPDSREARRKGWRRIVLLFDFFFAGYGELALGHPERDPGGTASRAALDALLGAVTASLVRNYGRFVEDPASINLCHFRHGCGAAVPPDVSARTTHTKKKTACEEEDGALRRPGPSEEPARKKTKVGAATG